MQIRPCRATCLDCVKPREHARCAASQFCDGNRNLVQQRSPSKPTCLTRDCAASPHVSKLIMALMLCFARVASM
jgi:hypothetical protein